jgi:hypothetical protein
MTTREVSQGNANGCEIARHSGHQATSLYRLKQAPCQPIRGKERVDFDAGMNMLTQAQRWFFYINTVNYYSRPQPISIYFMNGPMNRTMVLNLLKTCGDFLTTAGGNLFGNREPRVDFFIY